MPATGAAAGAVGAVAAGAVAAAAVGASVGALAADARRHQKRRCGASKASNQVYHSLFLEA